MNEIKIAAGEDSTESSNNESYNLWQKAMDDALPFNGGEYEQETQDKLKSEFLQGEYAYERDEILDNPDYIGASFSEILGDARFLPYMNKCYDDLTEAEKLRIGSKEAFEAKKKEEILTNEAFYEYIDSFGGNLKMARFHASPSLSPFSIVNSQRDGKIEVPKSFINKISYAKEHGVEDITVTASLLHEVDGRLSLDILEGSDREKYIGMIDDLIDGLDNSTGLTIELGNEANENVVAPNGAVISQEIVPEKYASFYREVAKKIKEKHPQVRLAIAGVSLADPGWLKQVTEMVGDDSLIDVISMHPYRTEEEEIWTPHDESTARNITEEYKELFNGKTPSMVTYSEVEKYLKDLAGQHGAEMLIGEMQIGNNGKNGLISSDEAHAMLQKIIKRSADNGLKTYIWPRDVIPF